MTNHIIILSNSAYPIAARIKDAIGGSIDGFGQRCTNADVFFDDVKQHMQSCSPKIKVHLHFQGVSRSGIADARPL